MPKAIPPLFSKHRVIFIYRERFCSIKFDLIEKFKTNFGLIF